MNPQIDRFRSLLAAGQDGALLRFALASALAGEKLWSDALPHLEAALDLDPDYSAAWKLLGKCLLELEQHARTLEVCSRGIEVATLRGDLQAVREMEVFARRARKRLVSREPGNDPEHA